LQELFVENYHLSFLENARNFDARFHVHELLEATRMQWLLRAFPHPFGRKRPHASMQNKFHFRRQYPGSNWGDFMFACSKRKPGTAQAALSTIGTRLGFKVLLLLFETQWR